MGGRGEGEPKPEKEKEKEWKMNAPTGKTERPSPFHPHTKIESERHRGLSKWKRKGPQAAKHATLWQSVEMFHMLHSHAIAT